MEPEPPLTPRTEYEPEHRMSKDDPKRPWKAIIAAVVAGLAVVMTYADDLPKVAIIIAAVLVAGLSTFLVPNPKTDE